MAITFVSSDLAHIAAAAADLTPSLGAFQTGDVAILYARSDEAGTIPVLSLSDATGWTQVVDENPQSGRDRVEAVWWKRLTAGDAAPTVQTSFNEERSVSVHVFRGVDTISALDVATVFDSNQNDTTPTAPAITTVTDGCAIVTGHGATHDDITTPGAPAGYTLGETLFGGANDHRGQCVAYLLDAGTAGPQSPGDWTHASSPTGTAEWSVWTLALRPISGPGITDAGTDEDFDDGDTITITGAEFEAVQGTGTVELGDGTDHGTATLVTQTVNSWSATSISIDVDLGALTPGTLYLYVTNDTGDTTPAFQVFVRRAQAFQLSASANIAAAAVDATTARLTAPASGSFVAGRRSDDTNPTPSIALTADAYTEIEWAIEATAEAATTPAYEFRVVRSDGSPLDSYAVTPQWTVAGGGSTPNEVTGTAPARASSTATTARGSAATGTSAAEAASTGTTSAPSIPPANAAGNAPGRADSTATTTAPRSATGAAIAQAASAGTTTAASDAGGASPTEATSTAATSTTADAAGATSAEATSAGSTSAPANAAGVSPAQASSAGAASAPGLANVTGTAAARTTSTASTSRPSAATGTTSAQADSTSTTSRPSAAFGAAAAQASSAGTTAAPNVGQANATGTSPARAAATATTSAPNSITGTAPATASSAATTSAPVVGGANVSGTAPARAGSSAAAARAAGATGAAPAVASSTGLVPLSGTHPIALAATAARYSVNVMAAPDGQTVLAVSDGEVVRYWEHPGWSAYEGDTGTLVTAG